MLTGRVNALQSSVDFASSRFRRGGGGGLILEKPVDDSRVATVRSLNETQIHFHGGKISSLEKSKQYYDKYIYGDNLSVFQSQANATKKFIPNSKIDRNTYNTRFHSYMKQLDQEEIQEMKM